MEEVGGALQRLHGVPRFAIDERELEATRAQGAEKNSYRCLLMRALSAGYEKACRTGISRVTGHGRKRLQQVRWDYARA